MWRNINGYEGIYQVNEKGEVKNVISGTLRKPQKRANGYLFVALYKNGVPSCKSIHRLVAEAFIENEEGYPIVNHKDENKVNNNVSNLEWCTYSYNSTYKNAHKGAEESHKKPVVQMGENGEELAVYDSVTSAAYAIGVGKNARPNISSVCLGKHERAYGYKWKFKEVCL